MQEKIQRQITMLQQIPRHPRRITANEIVERLQDRQYRVGLRTVQRELKAMLDMGMFGIELDDRAKPFGWYISACWNDFSIKMMDKSMALAFYTLKHNANQFLPPQSLKQLSPYFEQADQVLGNDPESPWLYWACRVAQLPAPLPVCLIEPDKKSLEIVQNALLNKRQLVCKIQRFVKGNDYWVEYDPINPQGIRISDGVPLLIFTIGKLHHKIYARPLDSLKDIRLLETPIIEIPTQKLPEQIQKSNTIDIKLLFSPQSNFILRNAKLSEDQTCVRLNDGNYYVCATVIDTPSLRAYLWQMNDTVEVVAPSKLRSHFARLYSKLHQKYQHGAIISNAPPGYSGKNTVKGMDICTK
ncbi:WYL domain-containing transcriptional regulator [Shewanella sp. Isolate11]|uniref:helix-turn-helix transcriptional regulator n=1 Tax=Shewanella sp. Isolate11 TaxID=2908530 RepID=UPI001EFE47FB|nr:WYL domain-containing transcriptional regulator [Shewanella sp. Isolate11]MCG9698361.1 WYL domain-containing transcriptional regulator [Shewanella sp. Isolate11]